MLTSQSRRHRSWYLAVLTAVVLLLGSFALAGSASAQGTPRKPSAPAPDQAAPAHAARQHTAHHGGSSVSLARPNHFQAQADPDGATNGGVDQPGGTGGVDTTSQDGNNGSGNDADCEDDNRGVGVPGHCKQRPGNQGNHTGSTTGDTPQVPGTGTDAGNDTGTTVATTPTQTDAGSAVLAGSLVLPPTNDTGISNGIGTSSFTQTPPRGSTTATAAAADRAHTGVLPNTGAGPALLVLALAGVAALVVGGGLLRRGRAAA